MKPEARPEPLSGALERLRALRPSLPPAAARIANFIIGNAADVIHMSVTEVAESAGASEGSVVALCQQLGGRGFQQLKIALARDLVQPVQFIHEDLHRRDNIDTVIEKIFRSNLQALQDTLNALDRGAVTRAVKALRTAKRGVVQNSPFLGYTRRAEAAGLWGSEFGWKGILCGRRPASPGQARWG